MCICHWIFFFLNMFINSVLQSVYCRVNRKSMKYVLSNWIWYMSSVVYWSVAITTKRPQTSPFPLFPLFHSLSQSFSFSFSHSHIYMYTQLTTDMARYNVILSSFYYLNRWFNICPFSLEVFFDPYLQAIPFSKRTRKLCFSYCMWISYTLLKK